MILTQDNPRNVAPGAVAPAPAERFPFIYRREIDGLRAVAVLAVLFCHAGIGFSGGYVGVDVFFVISGFLITSLLVRDLEQGRFSMVDFWERRIRRIFPALAVVLLATMVGTAFYLLSADYRRFGASLMSVIGIVSNIYFWITGGYFTGDAKEKPLLHTWSLSLEEQFYLFLPVGLYLLFRFAPRLRHGNRLFALLSLLTVAGALAAGGSVMEGRFTSAYFLLPGRAWELLLGATLAVAPVKAFPVGKAVREAASLAGIALILGASLFYWARTPFPGFAALLPCVGAALVIWADAHARGDGALLTQCGRFLAWKPMVGIGLVSYSLYLWHWPFFAWANYTYTDSLAAKAGLIVLSAVLAVLSWRWVETPVRKRTILGSRKALFAFFAICSLLFYVAGAAIVNHDGFGQRFSGSLAVNDEIVSKTDRMLRLRISRFGPAYFTNSLANARAGTFAPLGATDNAPSFVLLGDSHAEMILPLVDKMLAEAKISGLFMGGSALCPIVGIEDENSALGPEIAEAIISHLEQHPELQTILFVLRWSGRYHHDKEHFVPGFLETIRRLKGAGRKIIILKQMPESSHNVPRMVGRKVPPRLWAPTEASHREQNREINAVIDSLPGVWSVDPLPAFLRKGHEHLWMEEKGVALYWDKDHLTDEGAQMIMGPFLGNRLLPLIRSEAVQPSGE